MCPLSEVPLQLQECFLAFVYMLFFLQIKVMTACMHDVLSPKPAPFLAYLETSRQRLHKHLQRHCKIGSVISGHTGIHVACNLHDIPWYQWTCVHACLSVCPSLSNMHVWTSHWVGLVTGQLDCFFGGVSSHWNDVWSPTSLNGYVIKPACLLHVQLLHACTLRHFFAA